MLNSITSPRLPEISGVLAATEAPDTAAITAAITVEKIIANAIVGAARHQNPRRRFDEAFTTWRQILAGVDESDARWEIFGEAVEDIARFVARGADKADIADKLKHLAQAYMAEADADDVQCVIADAIARAERVPDDIEAPKGNGHDKAASKAPPILSKAEFLKGFVPPDYIVDGVLQRRFIYALTGQTGHAKTAIALLLARLVSSASGNARLGTHDVEKGRVVYFVGENPDDVRMRVIGADSKRGDDPSADRISFIPGVFNIAEMYAVHAAEVQKFGGVDLVIVDTSAAYFLGNDEISNTQMGAHARMLRMLTALSGGPCVLVLCHPIKHTNDPTQLLPRGGGAFLNEMDGNLTAWLHDEVLVTLHHGKFRGPGFEPMTFRIEKITTTKLVDSKGRLIPTVQVLPVSESEEEAEAQHARADDDRVLAELRKNANRSIAELARACSWTSSNGEPHKSKVHRALERLAKDKLVKKKRGRWMLTDEGEEIADRAEEVKREDRVEDRGGSTSKQSFRPNIGERTRQGVPCAHCSRTDGDIFKISDGRVKRGHREALHKDCARPFFAGEFPLETFQK